MNEYCERRAFLWEQSPLLRNRKICERVISSVSVFRLKKIHSDYYNGYHPKEIRGGEWYKDRFGDTSKPRFCIVIGREDNNVLYLPMTSRHARCDNKHQYTLQDNSMTWKKNEDMKSYVELDTLRAVQHRRKTGTSAVVWPGS